VEGAGTAKWGWPTGQRGVGEQSAQRRWSIGNANTHPPPPRGLSGGARTLPQLEVSLRGHLASCRCKPGLLGSFLWYRPGLRQCRFRTGYIGPKSPDFLRPKAGFTAGQSSFTAVPSRQHTCFPTALVQTDSCMCFSAGQACGGSTYRTGCGPCFSGRDG
jgi:hypothetical protein